AGHARVAQRQRAVVAAAHEEREAPDVAHGALLLGGARAATEHDAPLGEEPRLELVEEALRLLLVPGRAQARAQRLLRLVAPPEQHAVLVLGEVVALLALAAPPPLLAEQERLDALDLAGLLVGVGGGLHPAAELV